MAGSQPAHFSRALSAARTQRRPARQDQEAVLTITITLDRYGHPMPGSEVEARAMLDASLDDSQA